MDLRAHVLAEGDPAAELDAADRPRGEAQVDHGRVDIAVGRRFRVDLHGTRRLELDDLRAHEEPGGVELVDAHVEHDPAADPRVEDGRRRRIRVVLAAVEEERPAQLAGDDPGPRANVVRVVPAHEADLQADTRSLDRSEDGVRLGEVQRERLLAQDVLACGGRRFDDRPMVDR